METCTQHSQLEEVIRDEWKSKRESLDTFVSHRQANQMPSRAQASSPKFSGYTFVEETWRTHTIDQPRCTTSDGRPTLPAPCLSGGAPASIPTLAQKASDEDRILWGSSSSSAEYETRKQALLESQRAERARFQASEPSFRLFPALIPELRREIWLHAIAADPVKVTLTHKSWTINHPRVGSRCGTIGRTITDYGARATLPPLMLVNQESNYIASKHYRRAFRSVNGSGGVTAGLPTVLEVDQSTLSLVKLDDDLDLITKFTMNLGYMRRWATPAVLSSILDKFQSASQTGTHSPEVVLRVTKLPGATASTSDAELHEAHRLACDLRKMVSNRKALYPENEVPRVSLVVEEKGEADKVSIIGSSTVAHACQEDWTGDGEARKEYKPFVLM